MKKWFRRLAEVPNMNFEGRSSIDRTQLSRWNEVPQDENYQDDDQTDFYLMWSTIEGNTSQSPAASWKTIPRPGEVPAETTLRQLYERLELPGTLRDYHHAISECHAQLYRGVRKSPWVLEALEKLCWMDIRIVELYPASITYKVDGETIFEPVSAFNRLIELYEKEGYVNEALRVANIARKYGQCDEMFEELTMRVAAIAEEGNDP